MRKIISIIICAATIAGCAPTNRVIRSGNVRISETNVDKITNGMNKEQVSAILGKPFSRSVLQPMGETWMYTVSETHVETPPLFSLSVTPKMKVGSKSVIIAFDGDGLVSSVSRNYVSPEFDTVVYDENSFVP